MRDTAIGGVVLLFARTEWRDSSDGAAITETVLAALHDERPSYG
jgi:hypothetical protein